MEETGKTTCLPCSSLDVSPVSPVLLISPVFYSQQTTSVKPEGGAIRKTMAHVITKKEPEPPLPNPFELPRNYPAAVMVGLEKGILSGKTKSKFIGSVAAAIYRYKSYPSREEYERISKQIIIKCPFLRSSSGTGYVSCS